MNRAEAAERSVMVIPRPSARDAFRSSEPVKIDFAILSSKFDLRLSDAARSFGLSITAFKQVCRRLGVARWPRRLRPRSGAPGGPGRDRSSSLGEDSDSDDEAHETRKRPAQAMAMKPAADDNCVRVTAATASAAAGSPAFFSGTTVPYPVPCCYSKLEGVNVSGLCYPKATANLTMHAVNNVSLPDDNRAPWLRLNSVSTSSLNPTFPAVVDAQAAAKRPCLIDSLFRRTPMSQQADLLPASLVHSPARILSPPHTTHLSTSNAAASLQEHVACLQELRHLTAFPTLKMLVSCEGEARGCI